MSTRQPAASSLEGDSTQQLSQCMTEVQAANSCTFWNPLSFRQNKLDIYLKMAPVSLDIPAASQAYTERLFSVLLQLDNWVQRYG